MQDMQVYDSTHQPPGGVTITDSDGREWVRVVHGWWNPTGNEPLLTWPLLTWDELRDRGPLCTD